MPPRLAAILALLAPCERLADVGTDHALVPVAAVAAGLARRAWGVDRKPAPLEAAAATVAGEPRVTLVLGDGLAPLAGVRPDAVVMAGIGGAAIVRVLSAADLGEVTQLVLQPNTEAERVRAWARAAGWHVAAEALPVERGRWFQTVRLVPGAGPDPAYALPGFTPEELEELGPGLLRAGGPAIEAWLAAHAARLADADRQAGRPPGPLASAFARGLAHVRAGLLP